VDYPRDTLALQICGSRASASSITPTGSP
jgi:hypothetical protein